jgi:hypothetical protein
MNLRIPKYGKDDCKIRSGYRVVGSNTADGSLHDWYAGTLEEANNLAKHLANSTGEEVDVLKYLGTWRPAEPPMEFIKATDAEECDATKSDSSNVDGQQVTTH